MDTVNLQSNPDDDPLFIVLISIHGLIRGHDLELGRDTDTGGQTKYVVEMARALGERREVGKVVLLTRRVVDDQVSPDYAVPHEPLSEKAAIVRIDCGEPHYLRKELLLESLENFADNALAYLKTKYGRTPHLIHSHYADAGYVGTRLSLQLGVPLVHTGHSLGRSKLMRLLASGMSFDEIEATYRISLRIKAEESTLGVAERIITSTQQEIEEQYGLYDFYQPERMRVVPPRHRPGLLLSPSRRRAQEQYRPGGGQVLGKPRETADPRPVAPRPEKEYCLADRGLRRVAGAARGRQSADHLRKPV